MGILNELREEANKKKNKELERKDSQQILESVYKSELLPALQHVYKFFKEIVEYLEILEDPIIIKEYSNKYQDFNDLVQKLYKIKTDKYGGATKFNELKEITLRYFYIGEGAFTLEAFTQAEIDQHIKLLSAHKVPFDWSRQFNAVTNSLATFTIERKIPVIIKFEVDIQSSRINLKIINHSNFDVTKRTYKASEIDENFLDKLARYLLHKDNSFLQIDISEEEKAAIRAKIKEKQEKDTLYAGRDSINPNSESSLVGKFKSMFGKS